MRALLTIGEAAKLVGVTPKAIRHYHKLGLLAEPERSEGGYRLYSGEDLLRLARIRKLKTLGLSLKQVQDVLGEPDGERPLRQVLEALLGELSRKIDRMEQQRKKIKEVLAREDPYPTTDPPGKPYALELAEEHLAEHLSPARPGRTGTRDEDVGKPGGLRVARRIQRDAGDPGFATTPSIQKNAGRCSQSKNAL